VVRRATLVLLGMAVGACSDLRDFKGTWAGHRTGTAVVQQTGVTGPDAQLIFDRLDDHSFAGRIAVDGLMPQTPIGSIPGVEADVLAGMTFTGDPLKVYLSFVPLPDGNGDALVVISLYEDKRVEVRLLRSGVSPLYGIWALTEAPSASSSGSSS
jgi:hypothetical protein